MSEIGTQAVLPERRVARTADAQTLAATQKSEVEAAEDPWTALRSVIAHTTATR